MSGAPRDVDLHHAAVSAEYSLSPRPFQTDGVARRQTRCRHASPRPCRTSLAPRLACAFGNGIRVPQRNAQHLAAHDPRIAIVVFQDPAAGLRYALGLGESREMHPAIRLDRTSSAPTSDRLRRFACRAPSGAARAGPARDRIVRRRIAGHPAPFPPKWLRPRPRPWLSPARKPGPAPCRRPPSTRPETG